MKAVVYCQNYGTDIPQKVVWRGELDCIPRAGEFIQPDEEWCLLEVNLVFYDLSKNEAWIRLHPDHSNEMPEVK